MKSETEDDLDSRIINDFMDVIVLRLLKTNSALCGYDMVRYFYKRFHRLPSSGTVYSLLYSLERKGFIQGDSNGRKRVYKITKHGEEFLRQIGSSKQRNLAVFSSIFAEM